MRGRFTSQFIKSFLLSVRIDSVDCIIKYIYTHMYIITIIESGVYHIIYIMYIGIIWHNNSLFPQLAPEYRSYLRMSVV